LNLQGHGGTLLVGYKPAIRLAGWSLKPTEGLDDVSDVTIQIEDRDPFWGDKTPTRLELELGSLRFMWRDLQWDGGSVIHVKGAPEQGVVDAEE
jgi:hypothetical protein